LDLATCQAQANMSLANCQTHRLGLCIVLSPRGYEPTRAARPNTLRLGCVLSPFRHESNELLDPISLDFAVCQCQLSMDLATFSTHRLGIWLRAKPN